MMPFFSQIRLHYEKYPLRWGIGFFAIGIIFDIFTLGRPDELINLIQQFLYLSILTIFYYYELKLKSNLTIPNFFLKWWNYHDLIAHFLYGSLLSAFTLFFIKSSSFLYSAIFLLIMFGLLVINELPHFQNKGPVARLVLLSLCWSCYLFILVPILLGFMGWIPLTLSILAFLILCFLFARRLDFLSPQDLLRQFYLPSTGVISFFILSSVIGIIPPVPLHLTQIGIYHQVEKKYPHYYGHYYQDWWRFYESGAQTFYYQEGDSIYVLYSVFAPGRFDDNLYIHWRFKGSQGYKTTDRIPLLIKGGRSDGYRGFAQKKSIAPGKWQVLIETTDHRVIGSIHFEVLAGEHPPLKTDIF